MPDGADPGRSETATAVAAHGNAVSWATVPPAIRAGAVAGLVALYPICKAYEAFKHRMPAASVWRMI
jgi:hypothetical protein